MSERSTLIVGGGGREHQLGLSLTDSVDDIYFAPGNAGTATIGENLPFGATDYFGINEFATSERPDLTIVGPEQPLVDGLVDRLKALELTVFGPNKIASRLEAHKAFAIQFMREFDIPHPKSQIINNEFSRTLAENQIITTEANDLVYKANGLAGGKGVILPSNDSEALVTFNAMFAGELFNGAGKDCVIIQERLHGPEISLLVICDGKNYTTLPISQDHKRLKDNDEGPNTGGMGAYAPIPEAMINQKQQEKIDDIVKKSIEGTMQRNMLYKGVLYIGLMLAEEYHGDPVVMEYNVRFGDPEAQAVLPLLKQAGVDTYDLLHSTAEGKLRPDSTPKIGGAALTVCLAAKGYPEKPRKGDVIDGLEKEYPGVIIQHGGTEQQGENVVTAGGRVIYVTGLGETVDKAGQNSYAAIWNGIHFDGMQYRGDIGWQARTKTH